MAACACASRARSASSSSPNHTPRPRPAPHTLCWARWYGVSCRRRRRRCSASWKCASSTRTRARIAACGATSSRRLSRRCGTSVAATSTWRCGVGGGALACCWLRGRIRPAGLLARYGGGWGTRGRRVRGLWLAGCGLMTERTNESDACVWNTDSSLVGVRLEY